MTLQLIKDGSRWRRKDDHSIIVTVVCYPSTTVYYSTETQSWSTSAAHFLELYEEIPQ